MYKRQSVSTSLCLYLFNLFIYVLIFWSVKRYIYACAVFAVCFVVCCRLLLCSFIVLSLLLISAHLCLQWEQLLSSQLVCTISSSLWAMSVVSQKLSVGVSVCVCVCLLSRHYLEKFPWIFRCTFSFWRLTKDIFPGQIPLKNSFWTFSTGHSLHWEFSPLETPPKCQMSHNTRGKIIRTVLCFIVYWSCAQS